MDRNRFVLINGVFHFAQRFAAPGRGPATYLIDTPFYSLSLDNVLVSVHLANVCTTIASPGRFNVSVANVNVVGASGHKLQIAVVVNHDTDGPAASCDAVTLVGLATGGLDL